MFHSKKDISFVIAFHVAIHRRPETACFAQAYSESHDTAVCQPRRNAKQTQNNEQTTGDSEETLKHENKPHREGKRKCVQQKRDDSHWLIK